MLHYSQNPNTEKLLALCVSASILLFLMQANPAPGYETELTHKIEADGGKVYRIRAGVPPGRVSRGQASWRVSFSCDSS